MTTTRTAATTAALWGMLALAAACWVVAVRQMSGMDMGVSTELGSFAFFIGVWVAMMAAMMLPGALPTVAKLADARAVPLFALSYIAVWAVVGLAVYALYEPHGTAVAVAVTIAAAVYELTPVKRECRRRCRSDVRSGFEFGLYCVGSSIGLMAVLVAWSPMSVVWMSLVASVVLAQKLIPPTERKRQ
jgi:predicted metal-binding membrane protein